MKYNYRHDARCAMERAKIEMDSGDVNRLRYAALELRMALEALAYERAQLFETEISPSEFGIWQPGKLLKVLQGIDPDVGLSRTVRYMKEATDTSPAGEWRELGDDIVIPIKSVTKHHNTLGALLHISTLEQLEKGQAFDAVEAREKCRRVMEDVEKALSSTVRLNLGTFREFACLKCGATVRRREGKNGETVVAECFGPNREVGCGAKYDLTWDADAEIWKAGARHYSAICVYETCQQTFPVWESDLKPGAILRCLSCKQEMKVGFQVSAVNQ